MSLRTEVKVVLVGLLAAGLSACGGSSGDGGDGDVVSSSGLLTTDLPPESEWASLPDSVADVLGDFKTANETQSPATLPTTGSATFAGTAAFEIDYGDGTFTYLSSDAALTADFDAADVTGTFSGFTGEDESGPLPPITGTLSVGGTALDTGAATFNSGLSGTLTLEGDDYDVGGGVDGAFSDSGTVVGLVEGTVFNPDSTSDDLNGLFVVQETTP